MNIVSFIKIILINFLILFFGIIIIELIFGNWFNSKNYGNLLLSIDKHRMISNLPYKSDKPAIYTTDIHGFRANKHELSKIDILVIGGSTTEQKLVDDELIWTKVLEKNLISSNINYTLNAGIGGQTSFGHIKIFDLWLSRFAELKPKFIIFYIGINDALFMIENIENNIDYEKGRFMNNKNRDFLAIENKFDNYFQFLKNNSATVLFFKMINGNVISLKYNFGYFKKPSIFNTSIKTVDTIQFKLDDKKILNYLSRYKNNLFDLNKKTENIGSDAIFITQSVSSNHWIKKYLSIINNETINYCKNSNLICFDLSNELSLSDEDFYDGIHYTPSGSKKIAEYIYQKLKISYN